MTLRHQHGLFAAGFLRDLVLLPEIVPTDKQLAQSGQSDAQVRWRTVQPMILLSPGPASSLFSIPRA